MFFFPLGEWRPLPGDMCGVLSGSPSPSLFDGLDIGPTLCDLQALPHRDAVSVDDRCVRPLGVLFLNCRPWNTEVEASHLAKLFIQFAFPPKDLTARFCLSREKYNGLIQSEIVCSGGKSGRRRISWSLEGRACFIAAGNCVKAWKLDKLR